MIMQIIICGKFQLVVNNRSLINYNNKAVLQQYVFKFPFLVFFLLQLALVFGKIVGPFYIKQWFVTGIPVLLLMHTHLPSFFTFTLLHLSTPTITCNQSPLTHFTSHTPPLHPPGSISAVISDSIFEPLSLVRGRSTLLTAPVAVPFGSGEG